MTVTIIPVDGPAIDHPCNGELPLEQAQKIVGGYVECVYSRAVDGDGPSAQMIVNEEGKLYGLPPNYVATKLARSCGMIHGDYIVGPAIVLTGDNRWQ